MDDREPDRAEAGGADFAEERGVWGGGAGGGSRPADRGGADEAAGPGLLFNLSDGQFGVVPRGAGTEFGLHPVGSGPFRFVSQVQDKEVVLERCEGAGVTERAPPPFAKAAKEWATQFGSARFEKVRFNVVPDTITSALELEKGSADAASNVLTPDMVYALRVRRGWRPPGGRIEVWYLNFNVADGALRDKRVRQAVALAMDRPAIVAALWRGKRGWRRRCCRRDNGRGRGTRSWRSIRMIRRGPRGCWRRRDSRRGGMGCG